MHTSIEALLTTLPRKVKVGAYDWRVVVASGENDDWGITEFDKYQITIWPDQMPDAPFCVGIVLHELLHVIYDNEALAGIVGDVEETIVVGYERGLIALFRDNLKLLTWIKRGLKPTTG
jgi:hypothetical protein